MEGPNGFHDETHERVSSAWTAMIGKDFEAGLVNLKAVAETLTRMASSPVELVIVDAGLAEPDWPERFGEMLPVSWRPAAQGRAPRSPRQDIDRWSWDDQAITLSVAATGRLVALSPGIPSSPIPPSAEADARPAPLGQPIGLALQARASWFRSPASRLYGGLFSRPCRTAFIDVPVLRDESRERAGDAATPPSAFAIPDPRSGSPRRERVGRRRRSEARGDWPIVGSLWRRHMDRRRLG